MSNVKVKNKCTYKSKTTFNKPSSVGIVPVKLLEFSSLFKNKRIMIDWDMSNVKIKDKYTYKTKREVNKPSWVGIVPVKLLEKSALFKNKK